MIQSGAGALWLEHLYQCPECMFTAGFCAPGLDLAAAAEGDMDTTERRE